MGNSLLEGLNKEQLQAVTDNKGILTVLAGAGSGKTRVLTSRIAHMIENGASPYKILAVTFTNKAAKEMKTRLEKILGEEIVKNVWVGTFHSICGRILRQDIESYKSEEGITWQKNFAIYDEDESLAIIKNALKVLDLDDKVYKPKTIKGEISNAKNKLLNAYAFSTKARDYYQDKVGQIFTIYEKALSVNNALDFDDLLIMAVKLLQQCPDVREKYYRKFSHILVDEFQDTNQAQYELIKMLFTGNYPLEAVDLENRTLCVVGDIDQSIYSWRGADYKILLNFQGDFPMAKTIKLEKNYRSVATILEAANKVIENNFERVEKNLYSTKGKGEKIKCFEAQDQAEEAFHIAQTAKRYGSDKYQDIAVLYRTNGQSRAIEEAFMATGVPYRMIGGLKFYERKEIKDIVAYLRLIFNRNDSAALKRIINVPKRAIGQTTVKKIEEISLQNDISMFDVLMQIKEYSEFSGATLARLEAFRDLILELIEKKDSYLLSEFVTTILMDTKYLKELEDEDTVESQVRIDNLQEFINVAREFEETESEDILGDFLSQVALVSDVDEITEGTSAVTLMTLHAAKGLEYPIVFMSGLEEGVFPHQRVQHSNSELEEERRLMYVGITRAQEHLHITYARRRQMWGEYRYSEPSRFIFEIPKNLIEANFAAKEERETYSSGSTFKSAVKNLGEKYSSRKDSGFDRDKPVSNTSFGKSFVAPSMKDKPVSNSSFGKNFVAPTMKDKPVSNNSFGKNFAAPAQNRTTSQGQAKKSEEPKKEFKNVISGVEQARLMAQKLREQREAQTTAPVAGGFRSSSFKSGDKVRHEKFGEGEIVGVVTIGNSTLYKIDFGEVGIKAVDAEFNRLSLI